MFIQIQQWNFVDFGQVNAGWEDVSRCKKELVQPVFTCPKLIETQEQGMKNQVFIFNVEHAIAVWEWPADNYYWTSP